MDRRHLLGQITGGIREHRAGKGRGETDVPAFRQPGTGPQVNGLPAGQVSAVGQAQGSEDRQFLRGGDIQGAGGPDEHVIRDIEAGELKAA